MQKLIFCVKECGKISVLDRPGVVYIEQFGEECCLKDNDCLKSFRSKRLAVVGARFYKNYKHVASWLDFLKPIIIISGGAKGVDTIAEKYAKSIGMKPIIHAPEWNKWPWEQYKSKAYIERNVKIVNDCDAVLAFLSPVAKDNPGTWSTVTIATQAGKPVLAIGVKK
jgi:hypothetical protein